MAEHFKLDVELNGQETELDCELRIMGYTHKIAVYYQETEIIFERDEEQNYRALIAEGEILNKNITHDLMKAIADALRQAFN